MQARLAPRPAAADDDHELVGADMAPAKSVAAPPPTVKLDPLGMPLGFSTTSVPAFTSLPPV